MQQISRTHSSCKTRNVYPLNSNASFSLPPATGNHHSIILSASVSLTVLETVYKWNHALFWRRKWNPLQYSCLENHMDGGAWQATPHGVEKTRTRLTNILTICLSCLAYFSYSTLSSSFICAAVQSRTFLFFEA